MTPLLEHLVLIRQQRLAMPDTITLVSERQAPLVERIEDLLDLIEATSAALLDNAFDHAEHLDHRVLSHLTQRLADVQGNIDQAALFESVSEYTG